MQAQLKKPYVLILFPSISATNKTHIRYDIQINRKDAKVAGSYVIM